MIIICMLYCSDPKFYPDPFYFHLFHSQESNTGINWADFPVYISLFYRTDPYNGFWKIHFKAGDENISKYFVRARAIVGQVGG